MSDSRSRKLRNFITAGLLAAANGALAGCASAPVLQPQVVHRTMSPAEEAAAIEAAKQHPIALTYERKAEPHALPVAPPPIPPAPPPPPQQQVARAPEPPPAPRDQVIIVGEAPSARSYNWPSSEGNYVYVDDAWTAQSNPSVYVDTWVGPGWGWGWGVGYPGWGYPPAYYPPYHDHDHWHGGHGHWTDADRGHVSHHGSNSGTPRYREPYRAPPAASQRRDVYTAPSSRSAAPSSRAPMRAPSSQSAPRRTVRMR
ncbi:MAG TPA: hypothetical protein VJV78_47515 [Polyangiales bacterium]|nr:hypothetical protein [Polyangiales bacterium]